MLFSVRIGSHDGRYWGWTKVSAATAIQAVIDAMTHAEKIGMDFTERPFDIKVERDVFDFAKEKK